MSITRVLLLPVATRDGAGLVVPHVVLVQNDVIHGGPSGEDVLAFTSRIVVEFGEEGGVLRRLRAELRHGETADEIEAAARIARPVAVVLAAGGRDAGLEALASTQTVVTARQPQECVDFVRQRRTDVAVPVGSGDGASLEDFASERDTHGVPDDVDLGRLGVVHDGLDEASQRLYRLAVVATALSVVRVRVSPCRCVQFRRCISLTLKVSNGVGPSGLVLAMSRVQRAVRVAVDEDYGLVINPLVRRRLATETAPAPQVGSGEIVATVAVGVQP